MSLSDTKNNLEQLKARGFFKNTTNEENLVKLLNSDKITFYTGYDPTNFSFHIGHMVPMLAMHHLQEMGHRALVLIGGGTAMIGDPTGRTEARPIMTKEKIDDNVAKLKVQFERFIALDNPDKGMIVNNADWLRNVNYLDFLRDIGSNFSVNRMLTFETYKEKLKVGLSFLEFNYNLLQAYDFLYLFRHYGCVLQAGGDDQWANMVSGVELIRRMERSTDVECLTYPLIMTSEGKKMGKSQKGAVFLSEELTPVYDFYQYWINTTDADVIRFMKLYTFLPLEEIARYEALQGEELREAKKVLAYEVTKIVHGKDKADAAKSGAEAAFGGGDNVDCMPTFEIAADRLNAGLGILDLYAECGLCSSKGEARRLIQGNGAVMNGDKITDPQMTVTNANVTADGIILRSGKKKVMRVIVK